LEERAAIVEEGAKVPREWAEGFARLCCMSPPGGTNRHEWQAALDGAGRFLDQWAGKAHALGWTASELFGLNPDAPLGRLDQRGAAYFLARREVVAVTADEITFRVDDVLQRLRRRPVTSRPGWEALA
jgi:hypothetical protein